MQKEDSFLGDWLFFSEQRSHLNLWCGLFLFTCLVFVYPRPSSLCCLYEILFVQIWKASIIIQMVQYRPSQQISKYAGLQNPSYPDSIANVYDCWSHTHLNTSWEGLSDNSLYQTPSTELALPFGRLSQWLQAIDIGGH